MSNSPFHSYGDELMRSPGAPSRAPADAVFVKTRIGGGRRAPKPEAKIQDQDMVAAEPALEEKESTDQAVLSNPTWDRAQGNFEEIATATVDLMLPKSMGLLTKVEFECWPAIEGVGKEVRMKQAVHAKDGRASATFKLYHPNEPESGNPISSCDFLFSAKHCHSESIAGPALPTIPGKDEPFEGVILYSPAKEEYLVCDTEEEFKSIFEGVKRLESLRKKTQQAWEVTDASKRHASLEEIEKEAEALFGGNATGGAKRGLEELLLIQENKRWGKLKGWNYISAHERSDGDVQVKGSPRRFTAASMQKKLDKLLKRGSKDNRKSEAITGKLKANLFKTAPRAGQVWEWRKPEEQVDHGEPEAFTHTVEAAVLRYVAGWDGGEIAYDPHKQKLKIGVSGYVSGSLFEGKSILNIDMPGPKGVNILGWLSKVKHGDVFLADPKRQCLLMLSLEGSFSAFVGASVQGALSLNLERIPKEEVAAEAHAFVGAQVQNAGKGSVKWAPGPNLKFLPLGSLGYEAGLSAGAGAQAKLKIEYENCKFRFEMMASATWGIGAKGGLTWEADAKEAWEFVGHLCSCVNFHFVTEISSKAHVAYTNYAYANYVAIEEATRKGVDWSTSGIGDFRNWLRKMSPRIKDLKFAIFNSSLSSAMLSKVPPQALGQSILTVMETRESTDFNTIINILNSTIIRRFDPKTNPTANHKLKWTLRFVSAEIIPNAAGQQREEEKKVALEKGIEIIRGFGAAEGKWELVEGQTTNTNFLTKLNSLLQESGIFP